MKSFDIFKDSTLTRVAWTPEVILREVSEIVLCKCVNVVMRCVKNFPSEYSVYTEYHSHEIMFHIVSVLRANKRL